jgi:CheY-like chemotaxis protein
MEAAARPRVICIDDEPHVASGLSLHLRRRYAVELAGSGPEGLALLEQEPEAAVIISDMRMPGMDGAELLSRARQKRPRTSRILLTGYAQVEAAIRAVNEAQVFRFLIKPCPPPDLLRAVDAACELHRALSVEQLLLEKTLRGSIQMLSDVLAATNPAGFGRATRIRSHAARLAEQLQLEERWHLDVAAMLSQLPTIALPNETTEKLYFGNPLSSAEQRMVERAPEVTSHLLEHIPRLELVREMLALQADPQRKPAVEGTEPQALVQRGAQLLKVAMELDALESQGMGAAQALDSLLAQPIRREDDLSTALLALRAATTTADCVREIPLAGLKQGMAFAADVHTAAGGLFAARGYEVTESFLERVRNLRPGSVTEPIQVVIRGS